MQEKGRDNTDRPVCVCLCTAVKLNTMFISHVSDDERDENSWPVLWTEGQAREYKNRHS